MFIKWCFSMKMEDRERRAHSQGKRQTMFEKQPPCLFVSNLWKMLEHLIFNEILSFFKKIDLISENKSGIKRQDSYVIQVFSITHEIYKSLDDRLDL